MSTRTIIPAAAPHDAWHAHISPRDFRCLLQGLLVVSRAPTDDDDGPVTRIPMMPATPAPDLPAAHGAPGDADDSNSNAEGDPFEADPVWRSLYDLNERQLRHVLKFTFGPTVNGDSLDAKEDRAFRTISGYIRRNTDKELKDWYNSLTDAMSHAQLLNSYRDRFGPRGLGAEERQRYLDSILMRGVSKQERRANDGYVAASPPGTAPMPNRMNRPPDTADEDRAVDDPAVVDRVHSALVNLNERQLLRVLAFAFGRNPGDGEPLDRDEDSAVRLIDEYDGTFTYGRLKGWIQSVSNNMKRDQILDAYQRWFNNNPRRPEAGHVAAFLPIRDGGDGSTTRLSIRTPPGTAFRAPVVRADRAVRFDTTTEPRLRPPPREEPAAEDRVRCFVDGPDSAVNDWIATTVLPTVRRHPEVHVFQIEGAGVRKAYVPVLLALMMLWRMEGRSIVVRLVDPEARATGISRSHPWRRYAHEHRWVSAALLADYAATLAMAVAV